MIRLIPGFAVMLLGAAAPLTVATASDTADAQDVAVGPDQEPAPKDNGCPNFVAVANRSSTDGTLSATSCDGVVTEVYDFPNHHTLYWVESDDPEDCPSQPHVGGVPGQTYQCMGREVPCEITVCLASCFTVLECDKYRTEGVLSKTTPREIHLARVVTAIPDFFTSIAFTDADMDLLAGLAANEPVTLIKTAERRDDGWHVYHVYAAGEFRLSTTIRGIFVEGASIERVEVPF